jgi:branched-chain amino acid transport system ATP-binding protein
VSGDEVAPVTAPAPATPVLPVTAPAPARALLQVEGLRVTYGRAQAVDDATFAVGEGERVGLIGPNGAGKTSTLLAIMGEVRRASGEVRLRGRPLPSRPEDVVRSGVAMVPEGRHLFPSMTVGENLQLGRLARRTGSAPRFSDEEVAALFPVTVEFARKRAGLLSGGQQQQVAIARALLADPDLLLLDEPSLGLSPTLVASVFAALERINDLGVAVLLVEQRAEMTLEFCGRTYVLVGGRVRFQADRNTSAETVVASYFGTEPARSGRP